MSRVHPPKKEEDETGGRKSQSQNQTNPLKMEKL